MAGSLQDQLLKAGLADKNKAKQIKKEKTKQVQQQRKSKQGVVDENKQQLQQIRQQKQQRDRQLNEQRKAEADKKAIAAQVKQLIEVNCLSRQGAELDYNFTDNKKIKKILVDSTMLEQLSRGQLAIVSLNDKYEVVPAAVAEKIQQRLPERVIVANTVASDEIDKDDPYADYQIPDDLMW
ncbi:DUF2058 domain-containing protein [uncultured Oceanicoccus sp.]|uniref:DUF2058 domain-containing protein n=1 Tax=uncultured Oceanicoccus sp. TaxID=1706381 RepID=UPI0030D85CA5